MQARVDDGRGRGSNPPTVAPALPLRFQLDTLTAPAVRDLVATHLRTMRAQSPACSAHALEIDALRGPDLRFWSVWSDEDLVGCGALKRLSPAHGELKSMHIRTGWRRRGLAARLLTHLEEQAIAAGRHRLSLETGSQAAFAPARQLYASFGYLPCEPFGSYVEDPNSAFMSKSLTEGSDRLPSDR